MRSRFRAACWMCSAVAVAWSDGATGASPAAQAIIEDWLYQAENRPLAQRAKDEIRWTQTLAARLRNQAVLRCDEHEVTRAKRERKT